MKIIKRLKLIYTYYFAHHKILDTTQYITWCGLYYQKVLLSTGLYAYKLISKSNVPVGHLKDFNYGVMFMIDNNFHMFSPDYIVIDSTLYIQDGKCYFHIKDNPIDCIIIPYHYNNYHHYVEVPDDLIKRSTNITNIRDSIKHRIIDWRTNG